jgi:hypothetical protein
MHEWRCPGWRRTTLALGPIYLLTYMALQPIFGRSLSEKIPPLYSISSKVHPVMDYKGPSIAIHAIRSP